MGRAKRVLLVWEQGKGFGHTTQLARLGVRLRAAGIEVAAAVRYLALATPLLEAGIRTRAAPSWPEPPPRPQDDIPASATITDALARVGLRDADCVASALAGWRAILDEEEPDLVVCDYAPLAVPAARGRCRIMQAGTGFCLPPSHLPQMPILHSFTPPSHSDAEVIAAVNAALERGGLAPIARVGELFAGDDVFVRSFPLIDPYADVRLRESEGPVLDAAIAEAAPDARGIFAYMHMEAAIRADVQEALRALGPDLEIYVPGADASVTAPLRAAGVRVHERPVAMAQALRTCRLLVHQGSAGVATDAILAGVPQFTLSFHVEHYLNGEALAAAGLSRHVPLFPPAARLPVEAIRAMLADEDALFLAQACGRMHREMLTPDPLAELTRRCLKLL